jgi:hypothetical protein
VLLNPADQISFAMGAKIMDFPFFPDSSGLAPTDAVLLCTSELPIAGTLSKEKPGWRSWTASRAG